MVLSGRQVCLLWNICQCLESGCHNGVLKTSYNPMDSHIQQRMIWPETAIVSRLRKLFLKVKNNGSVCVMRKALGWELGDLRLHCRFPINLLQVNHIISARLHFLICNMKRLDKVITVSSTPKSCAHFASTWMCYMWSS